jgi:hypothetical protein
MVKSILLAPCGLSRSIQRNAPSTFLILLNFLLSSGCGANNEFIPCGVINCPRSDVAFFQSLKFCIPVNRNAHACTRHPIRPLAPTFCVYDGCGFRSRLCPPWVDEVNKTKLHFRVSPAAGINTVLCAVMPYSNISFLSIPIVVASQ